jgi:hypothetical protein
MIGMVCTPDELDIENSVLRMPQQTRIESIINNRSAARN